MNAVLKRPNAVILLLSILLTFIVLRIYLHFFPNTDFNVGRYNIHHLYSELILIALGGIPLALLEHDGRTRKIALAVFGIGLSMALDEVVATDVLTPNMISNKPRGLAGTKLVHQKTRLDL